MPTMNLRPRPPSSLPEPEENLAVLDVLAQAAEEVESTTTKKRKRQGGPKKQYRKICSSAGCTNIAQKEGVCTKHHTTVQRKICIMEDCKSIAQRGGKCFKHGAKYKKKLCSSEGCKSRAINGGVCQKHGAKRVVQFCTVEGCKNQRVKGGVCKKHGAVTGQMTASSVKGEEDEEEGDFEAITNAIGEATKKASKKTKASKKSGGSIEGVWGMRWCGELLYTYEVNQLDISGIFIQDEFKNFCSIFAIGSSFYHTIVKDISLLTRCWKSGGGGGRRFARYSRCESSNQEAS
eukprot:scaffold33568_cov93-Skeletonema_dohrnii-CCMP3373.AAC.2